MMSSDQVDQNILVLKDKTIKMKDRQIAQKNKQIQSLNSKVERIIKQNQELLGAMALKEQEMAALNQRVIGFQETVHRGQVKEPAPKVKLLSPVKAFEYKVVGSRAGKISVLQSLRLKKTCEQQSQQSVKGSTVGNLKQMGVTWAQLPAPVTRLQILNLLQVQVCADGLEPYFCFTEPYQMRLYFTEPAPCKGSQNNTP